MKLILLAIVSVFVGITWVDGGNAKPHARDEIPEPRDLALVSNERLLHAVETAQSTVVSKPASASAWGRLGHVYLAHDWRVEAAQCYQNAARIEPDAFRWLYYLGRAVDNDP